MSKFEEMKQRLQRLTELSVRMKQQFERLKGPEGIELRDKVKKAGTRMGIGAGVAVAGLAILAVASVYIIAVIILLLNIALDRLWLSALIVVAASLLLGAAIAVIGAAIARKAAKEIPKLGNEAVQPIKEAGDEMKETVQELQEIAKEEAEDRQQQMMDVLGQVKKAAPIIIGAYVGYRVVKKVVRSRRMKKRVMLEALEEE